MEEYINISGTAATVIVPITTGNGNISTLAVANIHTHKYVFALYLIDSSGVMFYLVKGLSIEPGSTFILEGKYLAFSAKKYGLQIKLEAAASGTSAATVISKLNKR
jgi:hypothetical protein